MEIIAQFMDFFIHLDVHLGEIIRNFGPWAYLILFIIIFCETGLVVMPFLPGDSLIFAVGAFTALGSLNFGWIFLVLTFAAIIGDNVNYWIGHTVGPRVFNERLPFLKREYLERTHAFYEKYGGKTVTVARFIPIIRTFAPFVAGVGTMKYKKFVCYEVLGTLLWVTIFLSGGYYFGNIPGVKNNFSLVIIAIIIISVMPGVVEFVRQRKK